MNQVEGSLNQPAFHVFFCSDGDGSNPPELPSSSNQLMLPEVGNVATTELRKLVKETKANLGEIWVVCFFLGLLKLLKIFYHGIHHH